MQKSKHVQVVLMFTWQEFVNVKKLNSKEISIDGKMFDVKSITINQQNRIEVKGHFDIKEDKLLAKATTQHSQKEKTALQKMFQFMNGLFYESHSLFELDGQLYITSRYPFFESNTLVGFGKIDLPPPNC